MTEVATTQTLLFLSRLVKASLEETKDFWGTFEQPSKLLPLVDISCEFLFREQELVELLCWRFFLDDQQAEANLRFRKLVTLHIRISLLSDVFATAGYAHGRGAIGLLQTLMGDGSPEIVGNLGDLHRVSIWENIVLKAGLALSGVNVTLTPAGSPLERSPDHVSVALPETDGATPNGVQPESTSAPGEASSSSPATGQDSPKLDGPREHNAKALKHLTHGLPSALAPFFQGMVIYMSESLAVDLFGESLQPLWKCSIRGALQNQPRESRF
jgi:E3 ubiquitin-protein ligase HUWE1